MSEKELKEYMNAQIVAIKEYVEDNKFSGLNESELYLQWIDKYSVEFRNNYNLMSV